MECGLPMDVFDGMKTVVGCCGCGLPFDVFDGMKTDCVLWMWIAYGCV